MLQAVYLVRGLGSVQYLEKHHAINGHHRVVLGNDLLGRYIQHPLHHVDPLANTIYKWNHKVKTWAKRDVVLTKAFHRVFVTLSDDNDRFADNNHRQKYNDN